MSKKRFLKELKEYIPGKSIEETAKEFGLEPKKVIKLASNENPLGPSPEAKKAVSNNLDKLSIFPDPLSIKELKQAISKDIKIPEENIVLGAGSDGVFDILSKILINKGDEAIIPSPSFSMYEFVTRVAGGKPVFLQRDKNFDVPIKKLFSLVNKKTKIIFLCLPNNPSANLIKKKDIEKILKKTKKYVLVDEAYIEYSKPGSSVLDLFRRYQNLIITRTFSKAYGLANLRIGYGIIPGDLVKDYQKTNLPFFTSSLAVKAARAAIKDKNHLRKIIRQNQQGRKYLESEIKFKVYPSQANFILVDVSPYQAKDIVFQLQKKGIIIRNCSSFGKPPHQTRTGRRRRQKGRSQSSFWCGGKGMDSFVRISIGTDSQNKKLVKAINSF